MESKDIYNLQEAYMEVYASQQQLNETGKNDARIRRNISRFGGKYTPPTNWDPEANRGQGATVSPKQAEKRRRKALRQEEMEVYASPENAFESWVDSLLEEGYDLSDYTWDEMYEFYLDEAEGSYGQTPKATRAYGELASRRRKTPASEFKKGEKGKSVKSAQKHSSRTQDPDAGNSGKRSSRGSGGRQRMTQQYRDYARGESEYGHVGYDPGHHGGAPGSKPKGKKLERQRKTGVSESYDLYDIILTHLLDEGYAETQEAAEVIMVNMSEDWRDDIINEGLANLVGKVAAGVKDRLTGKKELLGGKHGYIKVGAPSNPGDKRVSGLGPVGTYGRSSANVNSNRGPAGTSSMTADGKPR